MRGLSLIPRHLTLCSVCSLAAGLQVDENLQSMLVGSLMRKVKSRNWKRQRYFKLQDDCMSIWYKSKKTGNPKSTCK
ncbi:hypothetical protein chiPu_0024304 [Chiloscyllium punctatum]|uniref:PH domain-containing protein n=1 Tax=Chiloscyllium punctatum TaxID=137246 RepID=A0A401TBW1_CHIPU|nr:hypothetical protein [Chiloscyllium punctatum]